MVLNAYCWMYSSFQIPANFMVMYGSYNVTQCLLLNAQQLPDSSRLHGNLWNRNPTNYCKFFTVIYVQCHFTVNVHLYSELFDSIFLFWDAEEVVDLLFVEYNSLPSIFSLLDFTLFVLSIFSCWSSAGPKTKQLVSCDVISLSMTFSALFLIPLRPRNFCPRRLENPGVIKQNFFFYLKSKCLERCVYKSTCFTIF